MARTSASNRRAPWRRRQRIGADRRSGPHHRIDRRQMRNFRRRSCSWGHPTAAGRRWRRLPISTSMSGSIKRFTSTMVVAGLTDPNTSHVCGRLLPLIDIGHINARPHDIEIDAPACTSAASIVLGLNGLRRDHFFPESCSPSSPWCRRPARIDRPALPRIADFAFPRSPVKRSAFP